jgi:outer membrane protein
MALCYYRCKPSAQLPAWTFFLVLLTGMFPRTVDGEEAIIPTAGRRATAGTIVTEIPAGTGRLVNPPQEASMHITVQDAVFMALANNRSLVVEKLNPLIQETFEHQERAVFDPTVGAQVSAERNESERLARAGSTTETSISNIYRGGIALREFFPTGTFVEADVATTTTDSSLYRAPFSSTRMGISLTQSLLRGFGTKANLARLRQARLETRISRYELRGFSESLVAQVENAYWDHALSQRQIEIVEESLNIADRQLAETKEMIQVGVMAEAELAALQAEVAAQQQSLINARSALESSRLRLLRLLNPPGEDMWERNVALVHPPTLPEIEVEDVEAHVLLALRMRPEMNQARLDIQQQDLEVVRTRNGLLPRMDLFVGLGKTGYAESFSGSVSNMDEDSYDATVGLNVELPVFNRYAKAEHRRALFSRDMAEKALNNLVQLVELDVRTAHIEVNRTREQIAASTATRRFQEEKLRIETEKFRVGRSTNLLVAQAQRDLLASRINEVQAVVNYLKALIDFYRREGSLLERRGIEAPGSDLVDSSADRNQQYIIP